VSRVCGAWIGQLDWWRNLDLHTCIRSSWICSAGSFPQTLQNFAAELDDAPAARSPSSLERTAVLVMSQAEDKLNRNSKVSASGKENPGDEDRRAGELRQPLPHSPFGDMLKKDPQKCCRQCHARFYPRDNRIDDFAAQFRQTSVASSAQYPRAASKIAVAYSMKAFSNIVQ